MFLFPHVWQCSRVSVPLQNHSLVLSLKYIIIPMCQERRQIVSACHLSLILIFSFIHCQTPCLHGSRDMVGGDGVSIFFLFPLPLSNFLLLFSHLIILPPSIFHCAIVSLDSLLLSKYPSLSTVVSSSHCRPHSPLGSHFRPLHKVGKNLFSELFWITTLFSFFAMEAPSQRCDNRAIV